MLKSNSKFASSSSTFLIIVTHRLDLRRTGRLNPLVRFDAGLDDGDEFEAAVARADDQTAVLVEQQSAHTAAIQVAHAQPTVLRVLRDLGVAADHHRRLHRLHVLHVVVVVQPTV